jgi:GTP-binding protein HflX
LAQAFRATLEELQDADLLLHVVDAADADREAHIVAVERILNDLDLASTPRLLVYNKIDRLTPDERAGLAAAPQAIALSARDAQTTRPLLAAMEEALWREGRMQRGTLQE